ncbi:unnamed protein product [Peronospora belbahrii]|uniref:Protein kinase domain-containing protein n=1 Tax=Peronospora belbahrii TaxID=622444 RepID=A0AAU9LGR8_9STRA|nr:unnamed protein product [Peronospora belbahrii]
MLLVLQLFSLLILVHFISINIIHARTDIVAQLYGNSAITRPIMPTSLNAALQNLVGSVDNFTNFPFNLQRAMLWSAGWVQAIPESGASPSDNALVNYVQVYVLCGRTMSDIFQSTIAFNNATECELQSCKSNIISYTKSSCPVSFVETKTLCALSPDTAVSSFETLQQSSGPMWSNDGQVDGSYNPQIFRSWTIKDEMCPNNAQFIAPCRGVPASVVSKSVQERTWCEPDIELGVKLWVKEALMSIESKDGDSDSISNASSSIAVVLGVLLGVFILASVMFFVIWRRAKSCTNDGLHENENNTFFVQAYSFHGDKEETMSGSSLLHSSLGNTMQVDAVNESLRMRSCDLAAFCDNQELMLKRITYAGIVFRERITSGPNREVWHGEYEGQQVSITCTVASSVACAENANIDRESSILNASAYIGDKELKALVDFTKEICIAAPLDHPNIARFIGLAWRTLPELCMVSEFVALGNLAHFLAQPDSRDLTWKNDKLAIAADISNALVYLHSLSPIVLHCDLKSLNILLTEDLHAKVSDFGLSRKISFDETMTRSIGTLLWTAPEVLRGERYSEKADIYSFGVVLAELDTCLPPYEYSQGRKTKGKKDMNWVPLIASGSATPPFRPDCPRALRELAAQCLDHDPKNRPPAMQIVYLLRSKIPPTL